MVWTHNKALGKLGNIVAETFVILDVSRNVSMFAHLWKHFAETKFASREAKMFPTNLCFPMFLTDVS
jgi:hypothetical protein